MKPERVQLLRCQLEADQAARKQQDPAATRPQFAISLKIPHNRSGKSTAIIGCYKIF
jgi:hypothetical protein